MKTLYIGIDLTDTYAMISCCRSDQKEPETISLLTGGDQYQIPASLYISNNGSQLYGADADKMMQESGGVYYDRLYQQACALVGEAGFEESVQRLADFLKRLLRFSSNRNEGFEQEVIGVTLPEVTENSVAVMKRMRSLLENENRSIRWMDQGESSYYYIFRQEKTIWAHDVAVFDFQEQTISFFLLTRDKHAPGVVQITGQKNWEVPNGVMQDSQRKDMLFAAIMREAFAKRIISGVFLLGDGFDGGWLKSSLQVLGPNRRVFLGKNLYTKGAAFACMTKAETGSCPFELISSYKLNQTVCLKTKKGAEESAKVLLSEGENWFDAGVSFDFILPEDGTLELFMEKKGSSRQKSESFTLQDLPQRPAKTLRLQLTAEMNRPNTLSLTITDTGFGSFYPSSGKVWEFTLELS